MQIPPWLKPAPTARPKTVAALDDNIVCALSDGALFEVGGADTVAFLQGQVTNDVRQVSADAAQFNAYLSPKGRILTIFQLFLRHDRYYIYGPAATLASAIKRLQMFVLRADVQFRDVSTDYTAIGLSGPDIPALLARSLPIPEKVDAAVTVNELTVIRLPGIAPRFQLSGPVAALQPLAAGITATADTVTADHWRLLDIAAAVPTIYPETVDQFTPQMVNLQRLGGVNFKKGCYVGQVIVARTQYLGRLKRRMYPARIDGETLPAPGSAIVADDQPVGTVVDSVIHPDGGGIVLAVLPIDKVDGGETMTLDSTDRSQLRVETPPYGFDA